MGLLHSGILGINMPSNMLEGNSSSLVIASGIEGGDGLGKQPEVMAVMAVTAVMAVNAVTGGC